MVRLVDGDRTAFTPLFEALWPLLRAYCRRALAHDADGDDAAQQAVVNMFLRASEFDRSRSVLPWAFGIAANECRTIRRRGLRRREAVFDSAGAEASHATSPEQAVMERELIAAASAVLGALRHEDAAAIRSAIGTEERPDIPPATFRKRVERAMGRLRAVWRSRHGAA
jgi:RNA polymerase sigma-70 factor (ECF subfamily)